VRYEAGFYIPEDAILHSHRRENLKSYKGYSGRQTKGASFCTPQRLQSPVPNPSPIQRALPTSRVQKFLDEFSTSTEGKIKNKSLWDEHKDWT
jgi:hypothetical protein